MAEILLTGIEMPKGEDDVKLIINSDGSVHRILGWAISEKLKARAIEVQAHGDLIDKQNVVKELGKAWNVDDDQDFCNKSVWRIVEKEAPIVIKASSPSPIVFD